MNPSDIQTATGSGTLLGLYALLAALVALLVQAFKTDAFTSLIKVFGATKPVPKCVLPWIALGLGFFGGALQALIAGKRFPDAALAGGWGLLSGALAIAGDRTVGKAVAGASTPPPVLPVFVLCFLASSVLGLAHTSCTPAARAKVVDAAVLTEPQVVCVYEAVEHGATTVTEILNKCPEIPQVLEHDVATIFMGKRVAMARAAVQAPSPK